jgi:hypothetical protein
MSFFLKLSSVEQQLIAIRPEVRTLLFNEARNQAGSFKQKRQRDQNGQTACLLGFLSALLSFLLKPICHR